jgi:hypothetical protein
VKANDPRFDPNGYMGMDDEEREEAFSLENYKKWLGEQPDTKINYDLKCELSYTYGYNHSPVECFTYDPEFGLKNVLNIRPMSLVKEWRRYGDFIDYVEEAGVDDGRGLRVKVFHQGFHPWDNLFCDSRTGQRLDPTHSYNYNLTMQSIRALKRRKKKPKNDPTPKLTAWAELMGFESLEHCKKYFAPMPPIELAFLCVFMRLFKNPLAAFQLRPMLYVYWS